MWGYSDYGFSYIRIFCHFWNQLHIYVHVKLPCSYICLLNKSTCEFSSASFEGHCLFGARKKQDATFPIHNTIHFRLDWPGRATSTRKKGPGTSNPRSEWNQPTCLVPGADLLIVLTTRIWAVKFLGRFAEDAYYNYRSRMIGQERWQPSTRSGKYYTLAHVDANIQPPLGRKNTANTHVYTRAHWPLCLCAFEGSNFRSQLS